MPSIRVDHREHRSKTNAAMQTMLKPFSSMILKPGDAEPVGSPRLKPHKSVSKSCSVTESSIADTWIYTMASSLQVEKPTHKLYYFAGGGFRGVPGKEHWLLCAELASHLLQYEINVVSYPLAPKNTASKSIPHLEKLVDELCIRAKEQNGHITLMGDSSGGNIALVLGLYVASKYLEQRNGSCIVESVFAMSPAVDLRNTNPEIDLVQQNDPILSRKVIEEVAEGWKGDWSFSDPRISPILADLSLFRQSGIKVDGVIGGSDVLAPDAIEFRKKLNEAGVDGDWLQWDNQMHCFPLIFSYHLDEGQAGKDWIVDTLNANLKRQHI